MLLPPTMSLINLSALYYPFCNSKKSLSLFSTAISKSFGISLSHGSASGSPWYPVPFSTCCFRNQTSYPISSKRPSDARRTTSLYSVLPSTNIPSSYNCVNIAFSATRYKIMVSAPSYIFYVTLSCTSASNIPCMFSYLFLIMSPINNINSDFVVLSASLLSS